jgi:hypothetical protein
MKTLKQAMFLLWASVAATAAIAQMRIIATVKGAGDSSSVKTPARPASQPKPYNEVITAKAKTQKGFFTVHKVEDKYYFEIPDSLLHRDLLVVNRISTAAAELRMQRICYAGDQIGENVIQFEKGPNHKMFVRSISFPDRSNDSTENGLYRSFLNNNVQPIIAAFDIKAFSKEGDGVVIDLTDYINGDNELLSFDGQIKKTFGLANVLADRSYTQGINAFPVNIEIKTLKTYNKGTTTATFGLNSSIVLLPKTPMQARYFDSRVGFFATGFVDYDANPQGVKELFNIWRWRLEPKAEDVEKYKRGELVTPQKPIVIYIDPATPKKWVPYLIQGINDWQVAFEKAGFKNAIIGREAPVNDSSWSPEDARHSMLVYKPSNIANATGPCVRDPRSGEILETHINWYHNVMDLLYKWYFIQAAAVDARARKPRLDDSLMGELVRFVSSHEIGHTLGLRHNWGASSTVPVENLRNKAWVEEHGHTPSIMDYARFNYIAQPEDHISEKGLFPRIGDYDKWAIEWGYRWIPAAGKAEEENDTLNAWIVRKLASGKQYFFGPEQDRNDPRTQNEDLGDDAMKAGAYGIKNLKRIEPHLIEWTKLSAEGYGNAGALYRELIAQYERYMGHVLKNIGGIMTTPKSIEQPGAILEFIPKLKQRQAMQFLQEQLFTTPTWLIDNKLYSLSGNGDYSAVGKLQGSILWQLLSVDRFNKLIQQQLFDPATAYTPSEMLGDLYKGVFSELPAHKSIDIYRRNLQKMYVDDIARLIPGSGGGGITISAGPAAPTADKTNDVLSVLKAHGKALAAEVKAAIPVAPDAATRIHLQDIYERLDKTLYKKD